MTTTTNAHGYPWREAQAPDLECGDSRRTSGSLRGCGYCGSMHPSDLVAALAAGATVSWADWKYGWPHKLYVEKVPNPHAGMLESRIGTSHATPICPKSGAPCESGDQSFSRPTCQCMREAPETVTHGSKGGTPMRSMQAGFRQSDGKPDFVWRDTGSPAAATTWGNFYTVHLQDATAAERVAIERAMGLTFEFDGTRVGWRTFVEPEAAAAAEKEPS